ncbi:MAG: hypothetical protein Q8Q54_08580 [Methylococcales bacterium]|nr:hypothetical protein [Methylococcales bacterium]MDP3334577.1 hypothetical protein [Methylococcaceae bacterium]MDP3838961.1 hypothetical protein [Methylococcales bacterium]
MHNKPLFAISILAFAVSQVVYAAETNKKNDKEAKMLPEMTVSDEAAVIPLHQLMCEIHSGAFWCAGFVKFIIGFNLNGSRRLSHA